MCRSDKWAAGSHRGKTLAFSFLQDGVARKDEKEKENWLSGFFLSFVCGCFLGGMSILGAQGTNTSRRSITNAMSAKGIVCPMHAQMARQNGGAVDKRVIVSEPSVQVVQRCHCATCSNMPLD